jgi:hypothetical protein
MPRLGAHVSLSHDETAFGSAELFKRNHDGVLLAKSRHPEMFSIAAVGDDTLCKWASSVAHRKFWLHPIKDTVSPVC